MGARNEAVPWDEFTTLREMNFSDLVDRYIEIQDTMAALELEKKSIGGDIEAALIVAQQTRVKFGDHHCVERSNGGTAAKISSQLLASHGVTPEVITACTIPGGKYTYAQVIDLSKQKGGKPDVEGATT